MGRRKKGKYKKNSNEDKSCLAVACFAAEIQLGEESRDNARMSRIMWKMQYRQDLAKNLEMISKCFM